MKATDKIENIVKKMSFKAGPEMDKDLWAETSKAQNEFHKTILAPGQNNIRRTIMKSPITKLAAAAVILTGVLVLTSIFVKTNKNVALAGVLERVEQARAYKYKVDMTFTERTNPEIPMIQRIEGTILTSNEYGTKSEMRTKWETNTGKTDTETGKTTTKLRYTLPKQKLVVLIKPEQKKYKRAELGDDSLAEMKEQHDDPREMMKRMLECEYTVIGRTMLDGVEVEGFETTDPKWTMGTAKNYENIKVKLWVDVETRFPVLWETDTKINEQMFLHTVFYDFQWNIPVVASDFEPFIPADYTPIKEYKLPSEFEEKALKGLRFYAEIFGRYPEKIDDQMNLNREFFDTFVVRNRENLTDAGLKLKEELESMDPEQSIPKAMKMSQSITWIGEFYKILVDNGNDPAYYGQTVGPEDTDAVLMRWKIADNEYRIIFGDLSVGNATAEELAVLEQP
jgi:hypothetical protein